jgi:hypothetical protein
MTIREWPYCVLDAVVLLQNLHRTPSCHITDHIDGHSARAAFYIADPVLV